MKKIIFLFLIVHCTLLIDNCFSQWQPDVRLTNNPAISYTSYNNAWCIASSGNIVHVVWQDDRDSGSWEIYYKRSIDAGISWGADTRLTNNSASSDQPSVSVSGQVVHVVWYDYRDGNWEIYYKRSTDGGISWGADTRLTNNSANSWYPSVSVSGSPPTADVHVVWYDYRDGNWEIYYKRSTDGGISWGADTRLTNNSANSWYPSVSVSGSPPTADVHVVWQDDRDSGSWEIYYKRSTDGGVSWGADTRLPNDPVTSRFSSVAVSGLVVHVVWMGYRNGNWEIYYKRSTDGGISWGADTRLTNDPGLSAQPSVTVSGQAPALAVHVVWMDERNGNLEIYYKRSTDGGSSWGADTRLTNAPGVSERPSVSVSGQAPALAVHVVWMDERNGNLEIYYKRDPTGNIVGITNIGSDIPKEFSLEQNYPNPFNPSTVISYSISQSGPVTLKVFNSIGQQVAELVNATQSAGIYSVNFNASSLSSGIYFYTLKANDFTATKKLMLIK